MEENEIYQCAHCKNVYEKSNDEQWNDDKAIEEFKSFFPEPDADQSMNILCEDCHQEFLKWFTTLTHEDKEKMKNDYKR